MAITTLSLPIDIPWRRLAVSEDMYAPSEDGPLPIKWHTSLAVFFFEPEPDPTLSNPDAVAWADALILTVKPQDMERLCEQISHHVREDQLVISFAAGIRTSFIERRLKAHAPVVRVMSTVPEGRLISPRLPPSCSTLPASVSRWRNAGTAGLRAPVRIRSAGGTSGQPPAATICS